MSQAYYDPATYRARDSVGYMVRRPYSILASRAESSRAQSRP